MTLQFVIIKIYSSFIKRLKRWGLALTLLLLYISGFKINSSESFDLFSRLEVSVIHGFLGIALCIIWFLLLYDFVSRLFINKKNIVLKDDYHKMTFVPANKYSKKDYFNFIFYCFIFFICIFGIMHYLIRFVGLDFFNHSLVVIGHQFLGWTFISFILVKYYLSLSDWLLNLIRYLREY